MGPFQGSPLSSAGTSHHGIVNEQPLSPTWSSPKSMTWTQFLQGESSGTLGGRKYQVSYASTYTPAPAAAPVEPLAPSEIKSSLAMLFGIMVIGLLLALSILGAIVGLVIRLVF